MVNNVQRLPGWALVDRHFPRGRVTQAENARLRQRVFSAPGAFRYTDVAARWLSAHPAHPTSTHIARPAMPIAFASGGGADDDDAR